MKYLICVLQCLVLGYQMELGLGQFRINSPPTMWLDRNWKVQDDEPIGSIVARVKARDDENDPLEFGLEPYGFNGLTSDKYVPFEIDNTTGVVRINESLAGRGGETFFLYVTVTDGQLTAKNEALVNIINSSAVATVTTGKKPRPQTTTKLRPTPVVNKPNNPSFKIRSTTQETARSENTETTKEYSSTSTTIATTVDSDISLNGTDSQQYNELVFIVVPSAVVCGIIVAVVFLFRKRICKKRIKKQKDEIRKEVSGCLSVDETMAMQRWRGPRAFNNRYEGWNFDRNGQAPPVQSDRDTVRGDKWEFPRHHLKVFDILGEGCFGQVWRCEALDIDGKDGTTVVAVKTLKENAGGKERGDLLQELEVMKMLEPHPNVVRLLACCTDRDPIFVIMEFVTNGKLQSYLRNSRAERYYGNMHGRSNTLKSQDLTSFAYQCARGMEFLSSKGIIHRDLAARNVLVGEEQTCKIADFGFARDVIDSHVYERKSEGRLPIRWMAPESLYDNIFSVKSDVWSFGVLVWEIVTLGSTPYPGLAAADVMRKVRDGYRLDKPEHCRRELYNIMYYCWDKDPKERPSFTELVQLLEQLLLTETEYIELERFPDHSYYNMSSLSGEKL